MKIKKRNIEPNGLKRRLLFFTLLLLAASPARAYYQAEHLPYFSLPPDAVCIKPVQYKELGKERLNDDCLSICIEFPGETTAQTLINVLQEISLYKTHAYIRLSGGRYIYYGFYVTDLFKTHPWHRYDIAEGKLPPEGSGIENFNLLVSPSNYICNGKVLSIDAIGKKFGEAGTNGLVSITLCEATTFSNLRPVLEKIRESGLYQYSLSMDLVPPDIKGKGQSAEKIQPFKTPDLCIIMEMRNNSSNSRIVASKENHRKDRTDGKNRTVTNIRLEVCIAERIEVVKLLNNGVAVELYNVVLDSVPMYPNAKGIYYDGLRKLTKSIYRMSYDNSIRLNGVVLSVVEFIGKMQEMGVEITKE